MLTSFPFNAIIARRIKRKLTRMSLKSLLRPLLAPSGDTISRIEDKIAAAQAELNIAQQAANAAALEAEDSDSPATRTRADTARAALTAARDKLAALSGALLAARDRQAASALAKAEEAETKRLAAKHAALVRLAAAGPKVDAAIAALADELRVAFEAFEEASSLNAGSALDRIMVVGSLRSCLGFHLRFIPGFSSPLDDARARWALYLPKPDEGFRLALDR
jgi:hypothetical protein